MAKYLIIKVIFGGLEKLGTQIGSIQSEEGSTVAEQVSKSQLRSTGMKFE
jgi:hypothetical protein